MLSFTRYWFSHSLTSHLRKYLYFYWAFGMNMLKYLNDFFAATCLFSYLNSMFLCMSPGIPGRDGWVTGCLEPRLQTGDLMTLGHVTLLSRHCHVWRGHRAPVPPHTGQVSPLVPARHRRDANLRLFIKAGATAVSWTLAVWCHCCQVENRLNSLLSGSCLLFCFIHPDNVNIYYQVPNTHWIINDLPLRI